jgi:eukaryotic-like serine/threonine-protein kinase
MTDTGRSQSVVRGGAAGDASNDERPDRVGQVLAGRYRIEKELGAGGMGTVYRAEHVHMRKMVAIKVLHREMTYLPEVVARFEREAVAAARIEHPHVAAATDFGRLDDGSFYLVLEYVEGQSLRQVLDVTGAIRPELALHIARQIADGLAAAHAAGIVHRDLKPDNVMLITRESDSHFVKVLDFGIAKVEFGDAQSQLTQLGSVFGTPEYMAPEQAAGTPVDVRADLYTLGIILYEMLCGHSPFKDDDLVVVLTRQMTAEPPPLPAHIDPAISALTLQLLAKDPDARPDNAAELVARIDSLTEVAMGSSPMSAVAPLTPSPAGVDAQSLLSPSPPPGSFPDVSPPPPSTTLPGDDSVAFGETVLSLPGPAQIRQAAAAAPTKRPLDLLFEKFPVLKKNVDLGGQPVPVWGVALTGAVLGLIAVVALLGVVVAHGASGRPAASGSSAPGAPAVREPSRDVAALAASAATGNRDALRQLEALPEADRTAAEWRALGRGNAVIGQRKVSLAAYRKALALDASLAADKALIRDIRAAAQDPATAADAMQLAVARLGAVGADLVWDVWNDTRSNKALAEVNRTAKQTLDGTAIRAKASPALLVALDLDQAKSCASYKEILPRAEASGDVRSLTKLKRLAARRGCGFLGFSDCWGCLRGNKDLDEAAKAAEARSAPSF